jgi:glycosyltransferase involved in cell wall biosynthesis
VPVVVHTPHGHVFFGYGSRLSTTLFIALERACAPLADRLIALTAAEQREHLAVGIGRPDQWVTIHSGVELSLFPSDAGPRQAVRAELGVPEAAVTLGTVGRLVPIKGQRYLLEAVAQLPARKPPLHLLLVGEGPLRSELVTRARALRLNVREHGRTGAAPLRPEAPTVHFLGLRRDVPRLLAALDLFVLPSLNEGMGRVLVEAMAMELPCVASRISGIPDLVEHDVTGLLVPPGDPARLAGALDRLLDEPGQARAMGRRGRQKVVPAFGRQQMLEKLAALYQELLLAKGIPVPPASGQS